MHVREMMFPIPGGGATALTLSDPATLESIEVTERLAALVFESLGYTALGRGAGDPPQWARIRFVASAPKCAGIVVPTRPSVKNLRVSRRRALQWESCRAPWKSGPKRGPSGLSKRRVGDRGERRFDLNAILARLLDPAALSEPRPERVVRATELEG